MTGRARYACAFAALFVLVLAVMTAVDRALGARAEFINAWSVVERLAGREPSAGPSLIAARWGGAAESAAVLLACAAVAAALVGVLAAGRR